MITADKWRDYHLTSRSASKFGIFIDIFSGRLTQLFEYFNIQVVQLFEINTDFSHPEFSQLLEQLFCTRCINVQRELRFPGRKPKNRRIAFMATGIFVMIISKADDGRSSHFGFKPRPFPHQLDQPETVLLLLLFVDV
jgi:hypothetical protein